MPGTTQPRAALSIQQSLILTWVLALIAIPVAATEVRFPEVDQGHPDFRLEQVASGLSTPWGMTFLDADTLLVTIKSGKLFRLGLSSGSLTRVRGVPAVEDSGQGGLLDVKAGPQFATDGWIYFTYSKPVTAGVATTLARARLAGEQLQGWQDLLVTDSATGGGRHFGSRIAFDSAGRVYFSVGDRGDRDRAQALDDHIGSLIRLNPDGSVPADNPFVGRSGFRDEIWSFGHRNPQGLAYDPDRQTLWAIEHGPRGGDEINLIRPGANYGWPIVSHGKEYWGPISVGESTSKPGYEDPKVVYIPSIAPGSLMIYTGERFADWRGNLLAGALKLTHINRVVVDADGSAREQERLLEDLGERIRALIQGPDGLIYLSTDSGNIYRMVPAG